MVLHDEAIGRLPDVLDELDLANDTIGLCSTDDRPHDNTWPDIASTAIALS